MLSVPATGAWCSVVPHAVMPNAKLLKLGRAGLHMDPIGCDDTSLMTTELGRMPVKVLLIKSFTTDRLFKPFGVIRVEQQAINCSSGENT